MLVALILVVVCVGFYGLFRWLVHSNAQCALLWHVGITERVLDVLTRKTRPQRILQAVQRNATKGNPDSVISAVDHYCTNSEWAMNVGDEKGAILDSVVLETNPSTALELGTYCGYSTVRIAKLLPPGTRLITMEMNPECASVARQVIQHAGLQDKVCLVEGASGDLIPRMTAMFGIQTFDFVFLDHWKDRYLPDLKLLETCGLLSAGSVLLADNVICPGTPDYLQYVRNSSKYSSRFYTAHLEYTAVHDGLEKSIYQGETEKD